MKKLAKYFLVGALFLVGIIAFNSKTAKAATTFNITPSSACTLADAITNANNDDQSGSVDCPAGSGADTINLAAGTYTLGADLPAISPDLTINGAGADSTIIDGVDTYGIFDVDNGGSQFTLSNLAVTGNGKFHAAAVTIEYKYISNVTIDHVRVFENTVSGGYGGIHSGSSNGQLNITNSEIDHNSTDVSNNAAGIIVNPNDNNLEVNLDGLSIHDNDNQSAINSLSGLLIVNAASATLSNSSIYNNTSNLATAEIISNKGGAQIINSTISNNQGTEIAGLVLGALEDSFTYSVVNSTIANNVSTVGAYGNGSGVVFANLGAGSPEFNIQNAILSSNTAAGNAANCMTTGLGLPFTSLGGNISSDDTCSSSMTAASDLNSTDPQLGPLADNGGNVLTQALLAGSPAIDNGISGVNVPTTDARGISRPQCAAYDSGAYEYNGTCPATNNTPTPLTYPDPITGSTVTLELPSDVTNGTVSPISPNAIPKDSVFTYPLGLTTFTFNTTIGATKTITLYYDLPGDPSSYTARKYNTTTKTFSTIPNATITRTTYNNKSMIKLTYDITDGGSLDQDATANGTIIDPVGLAQATVGVPNTGL